MKMRYYTQKKHRKGTEHDKQGYRYHISDLGKSSRSFLPVGPKKRHPGIRMPLFVWYYSPTLTRQPFSSGSLPSWMPVMVSYSFWLSSPIWLLLMSITSSL